MYDIESSTHITKYIPSTMCGYSMYQLTSIDDIDEKVYYTIQKNLTFFGLLKLIH